mmetsp:Transcript_106108/g.298293  ORF Transcript_106108/g.298293 Transcript_106108/m.298293 type:complete len:223 (+) Transcript_106108:1161-1829(+)
MDHDLQTRRHLVHPLFGSFHVKTVLLLESFAHRPFPLHESPNLVASVGVHLVTLLPNMAFRVEGLAQALDLARSALQRGLAHVPLRRNEVSDASDALIQLPAIHFAAVPHVLQRRGHLVLQHFYGLLAVAFFTLERGLQVGDLSRNRRQLEGDLALLVSNELPLHLRELLTPVFNEVDRRVRECRGERQLPFLDGQSYIRVGRYFGAVAIVDLEDLVAHAEF